MSEPTTWENIPMSQDDSRTIGQYISDQIDTHNADADAHMDTGASLASHREAETLDHPELSVQAEHITDDIPNVGQKAGVFAPAGQNWIGVTSSPAVAYIAGAYNPDGSGLYLVLSQDGHTATSTDGDTWSAATSLPTGMWYQVAAGAGLFVAAGGISGGSGLCYSADGVSWTNITSPSYTDAYCIMWDGSQFVASVNLTTPPGNIAGILYSADGMSWSSHTSSYNSFLQKIVYDGVGTYVGYMTPFLEIMSSTDLATWSVQGPGGYDNAYSLVWTGSQFVVPILYDNEDGGFPIINTAAWYSPDGYNWSRGQAISGDAWGSSYAQDEIVLFFGGYQSLNGAVGSAQSLIWNPFALPTGGSPYAVFGSPTRLIALTNLATLNTLAYSDIPA